MRVEEADAVHHTHTSSVLLVRLLVASENRFIPRQHKGMQVAHVIRSVYTRFEVFRAQSFEFCLQDVLPVI